MKKANSLFIVLGGTVIVLLGMILASRHARDAALARKNAAEAAFKAEMLKGDFVALGDGASIRELVVSALGAAKTPSAPGLSATQEEMLVGSITAFLSSYHDGSFKSFAKFRYPERLDAAGVFAPAFVNGVKQGIMSLAKRTGKTDLLEPLGGAPDFDRATMRQLLETSHALWLEAGSSWTNPVFCATCLVGMKRAPVQIQLNRFTSALGSLKDLTSNSDKTFGVGARVINNIISPTPEDILKEKGEVVSAFFTAIVRPNDRRLVPVPVFLHFYWAEQLSDWIPTEFSVGYNSSDPASHIYFLTEL